MTATMTRLSVRGLRKSYGRQDVLRDISFEVAEGEFIALVGPSGCGKSTLLRCIAGLEDAADGEIVLAGRTVTHVPTRARDVAMVFQSYALFPHLTVAENIAFGLRLRRQPKERIAERIRYAAGLLGLAPYLERLPRELSGGQRQRVAMGRALVRDAAIFLFDEPLSNLDAKLRSQMRTEIKALRQRLGITSIYVTHDQDEAMSLADRIIVLNEGSIEQIGTPLEVYDRPASVFVAGFIGLPTMNLVGSEALAGSTIEPTGAADDGIRDILTRVMTGTVLLGLRPDAIHLDEAGAIAGIVDVVEPRGPDTLVSARLPSGHRLYLTAKKGIACQPGDTVRMSFSASEAHMFDARSGLRLPSPHLHQQETGSWR